MLSNLGKKSECVTIMSAPEFFVKYSISLYVLLDEIGIAIPLRCQVANCAIG